MSKESFIPFSLPEIGEEEIAEVISVLRSGWITTGPKTKEFEAKFREWLEVESECIAVNSATAGLHLGLEAMGVGPGDEVITTSYTFTATASIIRYLGATPVLVDINPKTLCIDTNAVAAAITTKTKVIIPVHFAGHAANMDQLIHIARKHGIFIMEDAAHALPTTFAGKLVGTLNSDITVFSFYANKTITTGEGGMLVTRNHDLAKRARIMRLHGISRDAFDRFVSSAPSWYYEIVAPGYKYNMTDISAAIGIHQLKKVYEFQKKREIIANFYDSTLSKLPLILPPRPPEGDTHSWHLYIIQLQSEVKIKRDSLIQLLFEAGIGCSVHYIPLHMHPYWRDTYNLNSAMFPQSQKIYENAISLPIYTKMKEQDMVKVVSALKQYLQ